MGVEDKDLIDGCLIAGAAASLDYAATAEVRLHLTLLVTLHHPCGR